MRMFNNVAATNINGISPSQLETKSPPRLRCLSICMRVHKNLRDDRTNNNM